MKEHVDKISAQLSIICASSELLENPWARRLAKHWSMRLFAGWIIAIVCCTVLTRHFWIDFSQFAPPPVSCFANSSTDSISVDIRDRFHWLPVRQRIEFKICVLVFKCRFKEAPAYLSEMLHTVQRQTRYDLRSDTRLNYDIPRCLSIRSWPRSFAVSGPTLWNSLPNSLKHYVSLSAFKTWIFNLMMHMMCIMMHITLWWQLI